MASVGQRSFPAPCHRADRDRAASRVGDQSRTEPSGRAGAVISGLWRRQCRERSGDHPRPPGPGAPLAHGRARPCLPAAKALYEEGAAAGARAHRRPAAAGSFEEGLGRSAANYAPADADRASSPAPPPSTREAAPSSTATGVHLRRVVRALPPARLGARPAGIGIGDTVAVMAPNVPAMLEAHYGVPMAGAVLNALNYRLDARSIAFILEHARRQAPDHRRGVLRHDRAGARASCRGRSRSWTSSIRSRTPAAAARDWARRTTRGCSTRAIPSTTGRARPTSGRRWRSSTPRGRRGTRRASCTPTGART